MRSTHASPLLPLAWGFLGLVPLPLCALIFAADSQLARRTEIALATVFFVFAIIFFVGARWESNRVDQDVGDTNEDEA